MRSASALLCVIYLLSTRIAAFEGSISDSTDTWGPGGEVPSPVVLTSSVFVGKERHLTILPGCVISGNGYLSIMGSITAHGTAAQPIVYRTASIKIGDAMSSAGDCSFEFCRFESQLDFTLELRNSHVRLENCLVTDHGREGIYVYGPDAAVTINHCTIGAMSALTEPYGSYPIYFTGGAAKSSSSIRNSILGFATRKNISPVSIFHEVLTYTSTTITLEYNLFCGGKRDGGSTLETGNIEGVDPLFVDPANGDFHLQPFSPGIDAADPTAPFNNEPGTNGCRANVGYYGNTPEATQSSVQVTAPNGGEVFAAGTPITISWNSSRFSGPKLLEYSTDNGTTWKTIDTITVDSGSHPWNIPEALGNTQSKVRISYLNCRSVTDESDSRFSVSPTAVLPHSLRRMAELRHQLKAISVYDLAGRLVMNKADLEPGVGVERLTDGLKPGIYTVELLASQSRHRQTLVINK